MQASLTQKLEKIIRDLEAGDALPLTRLTVLKKWFENDPGRLPAFGRWMADRVLAAGPVTPAAEALFSETRQLLAGDTSARPLHLPLPRRGKKAAVGLDRPWAEDLHERMRGFQHSYKSSPWGSVRLIHDWHLLLLEESLGLMLYRHSPADAYKLAADYAQAYDPQRGKELTLASRERLLALRHFLAQGADA